jgi:DNA-binding SARP family transcriptional activator
MGSAVVALDEFDEAAHIALARALTRAGRRIAALALVRGLATRLQDELSEPATPVLVGAIEEIKKAKSVT